MAAKAATESYTGNAVRLINLDPYNYDKLEHKNIIIDIAMAKRSWTWRAAYILTLHDADFLLKRIREQLRPEAKSVLETRR